MASKGLYGSVKLCLNSVGFSKAAQPKLVYSSKMVSSGIKSLAEYFSEMQKSFKKKITRVLILSSPLQGYQNSAIANFVALALFGSKLKHYEIIIQVDEQIYYLVSYSQSGLDIKKGCDIETLINQRKQNEVYSVLQGKSITVKDFLEHVKGIKHQEKNYDPVLWNCQHFTSNLVKLFE